MKVFFVCTSLGNSRRGIESFFRECFDAMHGYPGLTAQLYKGGGENGADEHRLWCLPKFGRPAKLIGSIIRRDGYVIEQLSFLPALIRRIRREKPDIIFYSDINLAMRLERWRRRIGVPFKLLFSNGGPAKGPFVGVDHVQEVTPYYYDLDIADGEPPAKLSLVPYGLHVPAGDPPSDPTDRRRLREELGLPVDRPIVLSVGAINSYHKRMDYVINEVASMPSPRPFLLLLGEFDRHSPPIQQLAKEKLGDDCLITSVPYEQVGRYYRAADVFALASLKEGFGRVYLEALMHGLPVAAHDHAIMRYVVGDEGHFADFSQPGALAGQLATMLAKPLDAASMARRRQSVRNRFSWDVLRPQYFAMFQACHTAAPGRTT